MRMYDLIIKKRNGHPLTKEEIEFMVEGFTKGKIPDYQMSAMMMAVYFQGMNEEETLFLTLAMEYSGDVLDLSGIEGVKVDKHSTGGVGDKTSLALIPMVAACGVKVAKMSGRGLGHTGGTIDKLESFPGFSTEISTEQFLKNVTKNGISIMGQTKELAPADKKLYALRDVTATVDNMSLIASSIMSKKLAAGADAIVLEKNAGKETIAVISDMDQPLGRAVGNILEVKEAVATLNGKGPKDFETLCLTLGAHMLAAGKAAPDAEEAEKMLREVIGNGKALKKLAEFIEAQGGDSSYVYEPEKFKEAAIVERIASPEDGYISRINCEEIGNCSLVLGGGRETKESSIDLTVGLEFKKKKGDFVAKGETIAIIHGNDREKTDIAKERFLNAITFADKKPEKVPLIKGIVKA